MVFSSSFIIVYFITQLLILTHCRIYKQNVHGPSFCKGVYAISKNKKNTEEFDRIPQRILVDGADVLDRSFANLFTTNYQAESCWSTLSIPLMYNLVLWKRFLKKVQDNHNKNHRTFTIRRLRNQLPKK